MRYLGIDLGCKSAGLSITDKTNTLVRPLNVIKFEFENYDKAKEEVIKVINDNEVELVILGYPKNMDGSIGFAGKRSEKFKNMLEESGIKVVLEDERLTTISAENIIHRNGDNIKNTKDKIDSIAASIILESYLKRCKNDFEK